MIAVNHTLLSEDALDNLIIEVITRQATEYGDFEMNIQTKKDQLKLQLHNGKAVIAYSSEENICDIIKIEDFKKFQTLIEEGSHE